MGTTRVLIQSDGNPLSKVHRTLLGNAFAWLPQHRIVVLVNVFQSGLQLEHSYMDVSLQICGAKKAKHAVFFPKISQDTLPVGFV